MLPLPPSRPMILGNYRIAVMAGVFALATGGGFPARGQTETPHAPGAAASDSLDAGQIARLIDQLDDDIYQVRQEATRKLALGGTAAVGPLVQAARGDNLEATLRALAALKELGCSLEPATEEAAFAALESLAGAPSPTAERAKSVLVGLRVASQERAKDRLRQLGATIADRDRGDDLAGPVFIGGGGVVMAGGVVFAAGGDARMYVPGTSVAIGEQWTGKASDLRLLRRLDGVGQIALTGEQVTDEWLEQIGAMPASNVLHFELRRTKVTDAGLARLASYSSLLSLDVFHAPITDKSVDTLARLPNIQSIRIYGTKITAEGANALSARLPNARIDRRGGALLGVGGSMGEEPCVINTVQPNSAAAKAGILENDVIVAFDGKPVANFTELTAAIAEKVGGDKVEIELLRAAADAAEPKSMKLTVTLGEW